MKRPSLDRTFFADKALDKPYSYIKEFSKELIKELVENEDGVVMPNNFGILQVVGFNKGSVDYSNSSKYSKAIMHSNAETDGWKYTVRLHQVYKDWKTKNNLRQKVYPFDFVKFNSFDKLKDALKDSIFEGKWVHYYKIYNQK